MLCLKIINTIVNRSEWFLFYFINVLFFWPLSIPILSNLLNRIWLPLFYDSIDVSTPFSGMSKLLFLPFHQMTWHYNVINHLKTSIQLYKKEKKEIKSPKCSMIRCKNDRLTELLDIIWWNASKELEPRKIQCYTNMVRLEI